MVYFSKSIFISLTTLFFAGGFYKAKAECDKDLQNCYKKALSLPPSNAEECRKSKEFFKCIHAINKAQCLDAQKDLIHKLEQMGNSCPSIAGSDKEEGEHKEEYNCLKELKNCQNMSGEDKDCRQYKCGVKWMKNCGDKLPSDLKDTVKKEIEAAKERCGACGLKASAIFVLISALLVAIRSYI